MFITAECTFNSDKRIFSSVERSFNTAEYNFFLRIKIIVPRTKED